MISVDWPAPPGVHAVMTTRVGGISGGPWASLNLAAHVGDDPNAVAENRRRLSLTLGLPGEPHWLEQVHGCSVVEAGSEQPRQADASITRESARVCVVMTADCLPVLLTDRAGHRLGAAHAGWRGLADGVLEATVAAMGTDPQELLAWLGPAIGPQAFEVGEEVRAEFLARDPAAQAHFAATASGQWLGDLYGLARQRLASVGVNSVHGGGRCTYTEAGHFFSYRRDGVCGRMAAMIWRD